MTKTEIAEKLDLHRKWLAGEVGGVRADFTGANLTQADLCGADLYAANLSDADFTGANLLKANLSRADLSDANLTGAILFEANLTGADLTWADLFEANLTGADLFEANLTGANLTKADLSGADLTWANLYEADLSGANLYEANLSEANLTWADLTGADLSGAKLSSIKEDVFRVLGTYPNEAPAVLVALKEGRVKGSTYSGSCACLVGTIANAKGVSHRNLQYNADSPAERWFLAIREGDTPENSVVSAIAANWVQEFLDEVPGKV